MLLRTAPFEGLTGLLPDSQNGNRSQSPDLARFDFSSTTSTSDAFDFEFDQIAGLDLGVGADDADLVEDPQPDAGSGADQDDQPAPDSASQGSDGRGGDLPFFTVKFTQLGDDTVDPEDQTFDILVQPREPDGDAIGEPIKVNPTPVLGVSDAQVLGLPNGRFAVSWQSDDPDTGRPQLFLRVFSQDGAPLTDALPFGAELPKGDGSVDIELTDNGFTVSWLQDTPDGVPLDSGIAQEFSFDGSPFLLPDFRERDSANDAHSPDGGRVRFGDQDFDSLPVHVPGSGLDFWD